MENTKQSEQMLLLCTFFLSVFLRKCKKGAGINRAPFKKTLQ